MDLNEYCIWQWNGGWELSAARADVFTLKQHKEDRDARLARVFRHVYGLAGGVKTKG